MIFLSIGIIPSEFHRFDSTLGGSRWDVRIEHKQPTLMAERTRFTRLDFDCANVLSLRRRNFSTKRIARDLILASYVFLSKERIFDQKNRERLDFGELRLFENRRLLFNLKM